ncbi:MAG: hypothetical protein V8Q30_01595 [Acutalibacteraceae bacterium]
MWNLPLRNITIVQSMREGFAQDYAVAVTFARYKDFNAMMRET